MSHNFQLWRCKADLFFFKGLDSFSGNHQDRLVLLTIVALDLCQARFPSSYRGLDSVSGTDQDRLGLLTIVALDLCQARFQSLSKGLDSVSGLDHRLVLLAIVFLDLRHARFPRSYKGLDSLSGTDQDCFFWPTMLGLVLCTTRFPMHFICRLLHP